MNTLTSGRHLWVLVLLLALAAVLGGLALAPGMAAFVPARLGALVLAAVLAWQARERERQWRQRLDEQAHRVDGLQRALEPPLKNPDSSPAARPDRRRSRDHESHPGTANGHPADVR